MSIRMNYASYPIDYIEELKRQGIKGRRKAMAFMMYHHDVQMEEVNSIRFYAEMWQIPKSTAMDWIKVFRDEIDRFHDYWILKNQTHYKNVRKKTGHNSDNNRTNKTINKEVVKEFRPKTELSSDKEFNIYDDNKELSSQNLRKDKREFDEVFFIYRANTKFAGKKDEAFEEYMKIKDKVSLKELLRAIVLYLRDPSVEKRYNLKNFLKNEVFYSYLPKRMKIKIDGEWIVGTYKDDISVFEGDNGFEGVLTADRLAELFNQGDLEFIRG